MLLSKEQLLFIESNKLCILGTGKNDGSPQISLVYYDWDGEFLYISVTDNDFLKEGLFISSLIDLQLNY